MSDLYDRFISALGLDSIREDHLLGVPLRGFSRLTFADGPGELSPSLCRLPDGRTQVVFQVSSLGDHWVGFFPCTPRNRQSLETFLERIRNARWDPPPDGTPAGFWSRILLGLRPARVLARLDPFPDRHLESTVDWALVADHVHRTFLQFTLRGPRGFFRRRLDWTPELAASLGEIAAATRQHECVWRESSSPGPNSRPPPLAAP